MTERVATSRRREGKKGSTPRGASHIAAAEDRGGLSDAAGGNASARVTTEIYRSLAEFRFALRRFLAFSEAENGAVGVTTQQYQAMLVIKTGPESRVRIRDLAEQMLTPHNGAVQLVDRLVAADLAIRGQSPNDRRSVLVSLTKKGGRLLEDLAAAHACEIAECEPLLAESLRRLRRLAHK